MSGENLMGDDLVKALADVRIQNGTCQITLANNTPSSWGVTIVAAGVKFFYRNGTEYTDGPRNINLGSGGTATFISDDPDGCVFGIFVAMTVHVQGEGTQNMTYQDGVPDGECLLHMTVALGPASSVSEATLKDKSIHKRLSISKH